MNTLRTTTMKETLQNLTSRKFVAGAAAATMALGLSGCAINREGLKNFGYESSMTLEDVRYNDETGNVQADFVSGNRGGSIDGDDMLQAVRCGTYNGNINIQTSWEDRRGVSCHIDNVPASRRAEVIMEIQMTEADGGETEIDPYALGIDAGTE